MAKMDLSLLMYSEDQIQDRTEIISEYIQSIGMSPIRRLNVYYDRFKKQIYYDAGYLKKSFTMHQYRRELVKFNKWVKSNNIIIVW
jgi:hypothetical protein